MLRSILNWFSKIRFLDSSADFPNKIRLLSEYQKKKKVVWRHFHFQGSFHYFENWNKQQYYGDSEEKSLHQFNPFPNSIKDYIMWSHSVSPHLFNFKLALSVPQQKKSLYLKKLTSPFSPPCPQSYKVCFPWLSEIIFLSLFNFKWKR